MNLSLNHAVSLAEFWDKNDVYLVSWVPNVILTPRHSPPARLNGGRHLSDAVADGCGTPPVYWRGPSGNRR